MNTTRSFQTSRITYPATRRHIRSRQLHRCESLKTRTHFSIIQIRFLLATHWPRKSTFLASKKKNERVATILFCLAVTLVISAITPRGACNRRRTTIFWRQRCCTTCENVTYYLPWKYHQHVTLHTCHSVTTQTALPYPIFRFHTSM